VIQVLKAIKEYAGVMLKDFGRYHRALAGNEHVANGDPLWLHLCNRNEVLAVNPNGPGVRCPWRWTSDLHACNVRPSLGRMLATRAAADWPVRFTDHCESAGPPEVSFIIAHEGIKRMDHVVWTIRSILAQAEVCVECIVVDQSREPSLNDLLPSSVRLLHRPRPSGLEGWRKAWAFNQGAREAGGNILVFHDGDIVCPTGYAQSLFQTIGDNGAASIQRFLFNLNQTDTESLFRSGNWPHQLQPERVRQNWEGGTIAVKREAFFKLGGYDEGFVGWGGEDNEFFNRCKSVGHFTFGFVPFVHLWHASQVDKHITDNRNISQILNERLLIDTQQRISELTARKFGDSTTPDPLSGYREATGRIVVI